MATKTSIVNRALQILGYQSVSSIQQVGDRGAKAMERAYTSVLESELQKHYWHFAIKRASIPKSATPPVHTKDNAYPLPGDYIMLAPEDQLSDFPLANGWFIESGSIITNDASPLLIRYVSNSITESSFDALFAEAFAAALALATGEELTQSAGKIERAGAIYLEQIGLAKRRGSIINPKPRAPVSPWISMRG